VSVLSLEKLAITQLTVTQKRLYQWNNETYVIEEKQTYSFLSQTHNTENKEEGYGVKSYECKVIGVQSPEGEEKVTLDTLIETDITNIMINKPPESNVIQIEISAQLSPEIIQELKGCKTEMVQTRSGYVIQSKKQGKEINITQVSEDIKKEIESEYLAKKLINELSTSIYSMN